MKQKIKGIFALALALATLMMTTVIPVSAAEILPTDPTNEVTSVQSEEGIMLSSGMYLANSKYYSSTSWTTVASTPQGFNCNVYIEIISPGNAASIRMLDGNGNIVWEETNAIRTSNNGASVGGRTFYCGSNVKTVQIKGTSNGLVDASLA